MISLQSLGLFNSISRSSLRRCRGRPVCAARSPRRPSARSRRSRPRGFSPSPPRTATCVSCRHPELPLQPPVHVVPDHQSQHQRDPEVDVFEGLAELRLSLVEVLEAQVVFRLFEVVPPGEPRLLVVVEGLAVLVLLDVFRVALQVLLAEGRVRQAEVVGSLLERVGERLVGFQDLFEDFGLEAVFRDVGVVQLDWVRRSYPSS